MKGRDAMSEATISPDPIPTPNPRRSWRLAGVLICLLFAAMAVLAYYLLFYQPGIHVTIQNPGSGKPMRFLFQFGEVVPGVQMADAGVFYVYGCDDHPDCCKGFVDSH
jgi:hypothetical protein